VIRRKCKLKKWFRINWQQDSFHGLQESPAIADRTPFVSLQLN